MRYKNNFLFAIITYIIIFGLVKFTALAENEAAKATGIGEEEYLFHEPTLGRGELHITSNPNGAKIFLNGKETPYKAPVTIPDLIPGRYEVLATQKNYGSVVKRVWIKEGEITRVEFSLPNRKTYGSLVSISAIIITAVVIAALLSR